jgi:3-deoxy-D-manno-octulosonate 8-phosphate phosphatase (KDO 8-P phosphatase)
LAATVKLETPNSKLETNEVERRARRIKLLLMDCDGVLTDGRLIFLGDVDEHKLFHVHDGQGIALFHRAGLKTGVISARLSSALERRARELGIAHLRQNAGDKVKALDELLQESAISPRECAYIGDDVADIPIMRRVELAFTVADAVEEAKRAAHYTTKLAGGCGAVREVCDLILKAQGRWEELMQQYRQ